MASLPVCLQRLKISFRELHRVLEGAPLTTVHWLCLDAEQWIFHLVPPSLYLPHSISPSLPFLLSPLHHPPLLSPFFPLFIPAALHNLYSSKITFEYQLPNSSQKLNTTNECIVSVLSGLTLTALKVHILVHI